MKIIFLSFKGRIGCICNDIYATLKYWFGLFYYHIHPLHSIVIVKGLHIACLTIYYQCAHFQKSTRDFISWKIISSVHLIKKRMNLMLVFMLSRLCGMLHQFCLCSLFLFFHAFFFFFFFFLPCKCRNKFEKELTSRF